MNGMNVARRRYFVFDVESIGLHGEGFAVGWVVVDQDGRETASGYRACPPSEAKGADADRAWVQEHVCPNLPEPTTFATWSLRESFSDDLRTWQGPFEALVFSDCGWPVEARFLAQCVDDGQDALAGAGPYPLHDVASVLLACGRDPLATYDRLPNELPAHNPLADARQSARLLIECLKGQAHGTS